jgi:hypothetical protein
VGGIYCTLWSRCRRVIGLLRLLFVLHALCDTLRRNLLNHRLATRCVFENVGPGLSDLRHRPPSRHGEVAIPPVLTHARGYEITIIVTRTASGTTLFKRSWPDLADTITASINSTGMQQHPRPLSRIDVHYGDVATIQKVKEHQSKEAGKRSRAYERA